MMETTYVLLEDGTTRPAESWEEVNAMFMDRTKRIIEHTMVGDKLVSTVFLVFDHGWGPPGSRPVLFETMVFGPPPPPAPGEVPRHLGDDPFQRRYHTKDDAMRGHREAVEALRRGVPLEDIE